MRLGDWRYVDCKILVLICSEQKYYLFCPTPANIPQHSRMKEPLRHHHLVQSTEPSVIKSFLLRMCLPAISKEWSFTHAKICHIRCKDLLHQMTEHQWYGAPLFLEISSQCWVIRHQYKWVLLHSSPGCWYQDLPTSQTFYLLVSIIKIYPPNSLWYNCAHKNAEGVTKEPPLVSCFCPSTAKLSLHPCKLVTRNPTMSHVWPLFLLLPLQGRHCEVTMWNKNTAFNW